MGRYYSGDIQGKFWFAVQSSDDASFFGGSELEPNTIQYFFCDQDLPTINEGIEKCLKELGAFKKALDDFFKGRNGYNDEMLVKELGISEKRVKHYLTWYARLHLGEQILECVKKKGECSFDAEL